VTDKDVLLAIIDLRSEMKALKKRVEEVESNYSKDDEGAIIEELERQKSTRRKMTASIDMLQEKLDVMRGFND